MFCKASPKRRMCSFPTNKWTWLGHHSLRLNGSTTKSGGARKYSKESFIETPLRLNNQRSIVLPHMTSVALPNRNTRQLVSLASGNQPKQASIQGRTLSPTSRGGFFCGGFRHKKRPHPGMMCVLMGPSVPSAI